MDFIFANLSLESFTPLGMTLIHSLWQGLVLCLVLRFVLKWFKPDSARARYYMAGLTLITLVCWMGVTYFQQVNTEVYFSEVTFIPEAPEPVEPVEPVTPVEPIEPISDEPAKEDESNFVWLGFQLSQWSPYLVFLWMLGVFCFSVKNIAALFYIKKLKKSGIELSSPEWLERLEAMIEKMGIRSKVGVRVSEKIGSPLLIGYFKPVIILPAAIFTQLSPDHIESILYHELAHIKRHDYLVRMVQSFLELILFYHPVYWWLSNMLDEERELCCDDVAVNKGRKEPKLYAEALLGVAAMPQPGLALGFSNPKQNLMHRIQHLFKGSPNKPHSEKYKIWGMSLILLGLVLGVQVMRALPWTESIGDWFGQEDYVEEWIEEVEVSDEEWLQEEERWLEEEQLRLEEEQVRLNKEQLRLRAEKMVIESRSFQEDGSPEIEIVEVSPELLAAVVDTPPLWRNQPPPPPVQATAPPSPKTLKEIAKMSKMEVELERRLAMINRVHARRIAIKQKEFDLEIQAQRMEMHRHLEEMQMQRIELLHELQDLRMRSENDRSSVDREELKKQEQRLHKLQKKMEIEKHKMELQQTELQLQAKEEIIRMELEAQRKALEVMERKMEEELRER